MALAANFPVGMAPGMGLNAFFAFTVVGAAGLPWQQALGAVFISGLVFPVLSLTGVRAWLVSGIPSSLRSAIVAGIGLFTAIIALQKSGVIVGNEDTLVALGPLNTAPPLLALAGFLLIAVLEARRIRGAILIGIPAVTGAGWALGDVQYQGPVSLPPSLAPPSCSWTCRACCTMTAAHQSRCCCRWCWCSCWWKCSMPPAPCTAWSAAPVC